MKIKSALIIAFLGMLVSASMPITHAQVPCSSHDALCGPQSLLLVCRGLGVDAELDELRNLSGFDEEKGTTMLGLKKAAEAKGLHSIGMKIGIDDLAREYLS